MLLWQTTNSELYTAYLIAVIFMTLDILEGHSSIASFFKRYILQLQDFYEKQSFLLGNKHHYLRNGAR